MTSLLALAFVAMTAAEPQSADSLEVYNDSVYSMRELIVRGGRILMVDSFPLTGARIKVPMAPPKLGDILEKLSPGLNDKITHPFAIKARRRERRHAKAMKALEQLDRVKTLDELLREAYDRQMLEDSLYLRGR